MPYQGTQEEKWRFKKMKIAIINGTCTLPAPKNAGIEFIESMLRSK